MKHSARGGKTGRRFLPILASGILALSFGWASLIKTGPQKKSNTESVKKAGRTMTRDLLDLTNEDYFGSPLQKASQVGDSLEEQGFDGLIAGAPSTILIDAQEKFPIVSLRVAESLEASTYLFDEYALIAAMDLNLDKLYVGMFTEQKFAKVARNLEKNPPPPGRVTDGGALDLFARRVVPKSYGRFASTVILLGKKSNQVLTRISRTEYEKNLSLFDSILEKHRLEAGHESNQGQAYQPISIVKENGSPSIPSEEGISLHVKSEGNTLAGENPLFLLVSYNLPIRKKKADALADQVSVEQRMAFSILATGTRVPHPLVWQIAVIAPAGSKGANEQNIRGYFTIDVRRLEGIEGNQTYFIYAFSGSASSKSAQLTLNGSANQ